jgi:hypothetical protein
MTIEPTQEQRLHDALYAINRAWGDTPLEQDTIAAARDLIWSLGSAKFGWNDSPAPASPFQVVAELATDADGSIVAVCSCDDESPDIMCPIHGAEFPDEETAECPEHGGQRVIGHGVTRGSDPYGIDELDCGCDVICFGPGEPNTVINQRPRR